MRRMLRHAVAHVKKPLLPVWQILSHAVSTSAQVSRTRSIQGVVFPSAIPGFSGRNLVVFRDVIPPPVILLANREQILDELRRLADRMRR